MPGITLFCLLLCSVFIRVLPVSNQYKRPFDIRRYLILPALALTGLQGYPLIASGEEYGRDFRNYRDYSGYRDYRDYDGYSERDYGRGYGSEYGSAPALNDTRTPSGTTAFEQQLVQSIYANCYQSQRTSVANYGVPENLIMDYCGCASKNMVGRLSYDDFKLLEKIQNTGTPPPHELKQKMEFVAMTCRKTSIDNALPGDSPSDFEVMDPVSDPAMLRR